MSRVKARHRSRSRTLPVLGAAVLALAFCLAAGPTYSTWSGGRLSNDTDTVATRSLAFTHAYQATTCSLGVRVGGTASCSGSIAPTAVTPSSGSIQATDTIANNGTAGTAQLLSQVRSPSCAAVMLANAATTGNPLLPRYSPSFLQIDSYAGTNAVKLDGTSAYATSVVAQTQPGGSLLSAGQISGIGIWFKATGAGPLYTFSASATNGTGNADRTLYLDANGKLNFVWRTAGTSIGPTGTGYADGQWHFAYVTIGGVNVALVGLIPQVTLYVDGAQQATTPLVSLGAYTVYSGYWHLGWAPTALTGLSTAYSSATVSDFVVFNGSTFPTATTKPATQAAMDTFATGATEYWKLGDTGTTTYSGTHPVIGSTSPCASIDIGWAFTSPAGTGAASGTRLSTFADGTWTTIPAPAAGSSQTSTMTVSRDAGYNSYVAGLRLHPQFSWRVQTNTTSTWNAAIAWSQTFGWTDATAVIIG